ncbi:MAG: hypothetical protein ACREJ2_13105, partial [Planctomycetota bacterium]
MSNEKTTNMSMLLRDLILTTKDGDWGNDVPQDGYVPFRVIRGADFPGARIGDVADVPRCYLKADSVYRRTLESDDIIIETAGGNRDRPTGRTLLVTDRLLKLFDLPVTCASFCRFLRIDSKKANPRYVFWYLQSLYEQGAMWEHQVQHTGVARFQYTKFAETCSVPLPSEVEQAVIAHTLGTLDDRIEVNRRMCRTLEGMAAAVFKAWFVDFEPVRAKADGRWRRGQSLPGLPAHLFDLFPDQFQDSPLGPIPKGWEISDIGTIADVIDCLHAKKPERTETGLPFLQLANIRNDGLIDMSDT